jgi:hypothetical protein
MSASAVNRLLTDPTKPRGSWNQHDVFELAVGVLASVDGLSAFARWQRVAEWGFGRWSLGFGALLVAGWLSWFRRPRIDGPEARSA